MYQTQWLNPMRGTGRCMPLLFVLISSVSFGQSGPTHRFSDFSGLTLTDQGTNERDVSGSFSNGEFSMQVSGRIMEIPTSGTYNGKMKFRGEHGANNHDWLKLRFSKPVESITFDFPSQDWLWSSTIQESVGVSTGSWTSFSNGVDPYDRNEVSSTQTEFTPHAGTSNFGDGKIVVHNTDTLTLPRPYFTTRSASNRFLRPNNINRTAIVATVTFDAPVTEVTLYTDDTHSSGGRGTIYLGAIDAIEAIPEPESFALAVGSLAFVVIMLRYRSRGANAR
ncbi:MAG: hypothetical protein ACON46_08305 [Coraliomargaritaceae bacterium]